MRRIHLSLLLQSHHVRRSRHSAVNLRRRRACSRRRHPFHFTGLGAASHELPSPTAPPIRLNRNSNNPNRQNGAALLLFLRHQHLRPPPHLQNCSKFEAGAAFIWRCWTIALSHKPNEEVKFACAVDIRNRLNPPLPVGYYGNAVVSSSVVTTAEKLSQFPLPYTMELVRKAKYGATKEYVADITAKRDQRNSTAARVYAVSDLTRVDFKRVDFGWGSASYGGVAKGVADWIPTLPSWYLSFKDREGKEGIMAPICLPLNSMELFIQQLQIMKIPSFNKSAI